MFQPAEVLIRVGDLPTVLDGGGVTIMPLEWQELGDKRYVIRADIAPHQQLQFYPTLKEYEGFLVPGLSVFDKGLIETFRFSELKLKKVLLAMTAVEVRTNYLGSFNAIQTLSGCAQLIPLSDAEKLLCSIHGIAYEVI